MPLRGGWLSPVRESPFYVHFSGSSSSLDILDEYFYLGYIFGVEISTNTVPCNLGELGSIFSGRFHIHFASFDGLINLDLS